MRFVIYILIIIEEIFITIEQKDTNINLNKNETNINHNNNNENKNNSKKLKQFLLHIGLMLFFIISFYIAVKIFIKCCKKRYAFHKLYVGFIKHKLIKEEIIDQVKYVYGFNYVILFLKEKIFISCKYKDKYEQIKNCGNCSICLNGFNLNDKIFITSCNHVYHNKCMTDYIKLIIKEIDPDEKDIENFHDYFHCPNCKEFLYANRSFLQKANNNINNNVVEVNDNIEEINIENNNNNLDEKNTKISSYKSRQNVKINNIVSTESSSKRTIPYKRKNKRLGFKKIDKKKEDKNSKIETNVYDNINNNNNSNNNSNNISNNNSNNSGNKNDVNTNKNLPYIEGDNNPYQSNMKLKDNLEVGRMKKNNKLSFKVIRKDKINKKKDVKPTDNKNVVIVDVNNNDKK